MALNNTTWPSDIPAPPAVHSWLSSLFATVDSKCPDSGETLASLYSDNATVYGMHGKSVGKKSIAESRKSAWETITSRKHEILHVFAGKLDYSDLILIGKLTAVLKNGNEVVTEFIAQIELEGTTTQDPKGTLYKVWGDSAPWIKAMK